MMSLIDRAKAPASDQLPSEIRPRLCKLLEAIHVESPAVIHFADLPVITPVKDPATGAISQTVAEQLSTLIYCYGYSHEFTGPVAGTPAALAMQGTGANEVVLDRVLVDRVSAANTTQDRVDGIWKVYRSDPNGSVHVEKNGFFRLVAPGQYLRNEAFHRPVAVGDRVKLLVHRESRDIQTGFYYVFGETLSSDHDDALLCRFYFNTTPAQAPELVEELSRSFNRFGVPFRLKCLTNPAHYNRQDAMVCYIARRYLNVSLRLLVQRRERLVSLMQAGAPLFTKELMSGLGAADEPGGGKSFGQHRSDLVAQGILEAASHGDQTTAGRLEAMAKGFAAQGLSISRPHCSERMIDQYQLPVCPPKN